MAAKCVEREGEGGRERGKEREGEGRRGQERGRGRERGNGICTLTLPSCSTESTESQKISLSESLVGAKPSQGPEPAGAQSRPPRVFVMQDSNKLSSHLKAA